MNYQGLTVCQTFFNFLAGGRIMNKCKGILIFFIIVLLFSSCNFPADLTSSQNSPPQVLGEAIFHFIDVGQGDCVLIQAENKNILIDAGTGDSASYLFRYLENLDVDYIDYFINTHPHEDHLGGAESILTSIDVGTVFVNGTASNSKFFEEFLDVLIKKEITPVIPDLDCIYELGPFRIKFLSPTKTHIDENDNSLVCTVEFGEIKALFMGDAEKNIESELLQNKKLIDADILKVGHHGSRYASSLPFLTAVSPSVSVIQCGEGNSYSHPHEEAIQRLDTVFSEVYRTDKDGDIILKTDGKVITKSDGELFEKKDSSDIKLIYIGNKNSKVFHLETCANLPSDKNRFDFTSREDALGSGYKPCGNCNP